MIKRLLLAVAMLCAVTHAQVTVSPILQPHNSFVDAAGLPCAGCSLYSYTAGTTITTPTYTDASGGVANTNPIVLSAQGGANIWVDQSIAYKFTLKDALGSTIWTVDYVQSPNGVGSNAVVTNPTGSQTIVQLSGTSFYLNSLNNIIYTQPGDSLSTLCTSFSGAAGQVFISLPVTVPTTTTLPSNCAITVLSGGSITVSSGTLTINGPFAAPQSGQVFTGTVTGLSSVRPEWFGTTTIGPTVIGALGASGGTVNLRTAAYISGYKASSGAGCMTKNNVTLLGTQMPDYTSDFTAYQNGTIIQGGFQSCGSDNFTAKNIGFDVGSAYIAAGGTANDALVVDGLSGSAGTNPADALIQNPILENVSCLQNTPSNSHHCMLVEHASGASLNNIQTVFGTHGLAIKSINSSLNGLFCRGSGSDCLIIKGDTYTSVGNVQASHITVVGQSPGQVPNGVIIDAENTGTLTNVQVSQVVALTTNIAVTFVNNSSFGDGAVSNVTLTDLNVVATGPGGSSNACIQTTGSQTFRWLQINNVHCINATSGGFSPAQIFTRIFESQINDWLNIGSVNASSMTGTIYINHWSDLGTGTPGPAFSALNAGTQIFLYSYIGTRPSGTPYITDGSALVYISPTAPNLYTSSDGSKTIVAAPFVGVAAGAVALRGGAAATTDVVIQNAAGSANNVLFQDNGAVVALGDISGPTVTPANGKTTTATLTSCTLTFVKGILTASTGANCP